MYRLWLFLAGVSGAAAVLAAAHGAHALGGLTTFSSAVKIFETGTLYHSVHSIALMLVAILLAATEGRRTGFATWLLNIAALAFVLGVVLFSGGIYYQVARGVQATVPIVPAGGIAFVIGWAALALSAFGFRAVRREAGEPALSPG